MFEMLLPAFLFGQWPSFSVFRVGLSSIRCFFHRCAEFGRRCLYGGRWFRRPFLPGETRHAQSETTTKIQSSMVFCLKNGVSQATFRLCFFFFFPPLLVVNNVGQN